MLRKQQIFKSLMATAMTVAMATPAMAQENLVDFDFYIDAYYAIDTDSTMDIGQNGTQNLVPKKDRGLNAIGYRNNEFNLNTAQMTVSTSQDYYRGRFTTQYGTIPISSWSGGYLNIQEANLGFNVFKDLGAEGNNLWVDGGLFLTHIGNELLLPRANWLSTLALVTMFEPFYQAGVKVGYNWGDSLSGEIHLLNGYGNIEDNNADKTVGWLLSYSPFENLGLSWAGLVGNEQDAGTPAQARLYNNLNLNYQILDNIGVRGQVDLANEAGNFYYGAQLSARYDFMEKYGVTLRGETIQDPQGIVTSDKLQGYGITLGLEYKPTEKSFVRLEGRQLLMDPNTNKLFMDAQGNTSSNRSELLINTGVWF